jgi:hypothetical protein
VVAVLASVMLVELLGSTWKSHTSSAGCIEHPPCPWLSSELN